MTKTIFITGASTGIGKATALYFAEKGWNVAATMRSLDKAADLKKYPSIKLFVLDVTDEAGIKRTIDDAITVFGGIDVVFNNAGYALVGAFEAMSPEQIKKQFDTNVIGVMSVTRAILPYFRKKGGGTIITNTSMGGLITFPLYSVYHSTKWALEGFMESLHYELRQFNIRVKTIEPGLIKTEFENSLQLVTADAYQNYVPIAHQNMLDAYRRASSAHGVAKKVFRAALDTSFRLRYPSGRGALLAVFLKKILPNSWFFAGVRRTVERGIQY
jgi:NAD(P)-dependent dehydrogenase (short-subunit alcohol dehydrogenase family)